MLFKTYCNNTQRARTLHHIRVKALERVLAEGDKFHKKLESGEIIFGQDNKDVPFINACAAVHGLDLLAAKLEFYEDAGPINSHKLQRQLDWFINRLSSYMRPENAIAFDQVQYAQLREAWDFLWELREKLISASWEPNLTADAASLEGAQTGNNGGFSWF